MKDVYILGIETSCDETSVSIVRNGKQVISNIVNSQIDIHEQYGGVVPEIASRLHVENITKVIDLCLTESKLTMGEITAIAVTYGPGLIGALLIGLQAAKTLSYLNDKPLIPVHHLAGHVYANNLETELSFPLLCLVVSGGHTDLIIMKEDYSFEKIGGTLDDAVGEAYDKVARVLGLSYPGGPIIDKLSLLGEDTYLLPTPKDDDSFDFSFSGLKSAVINLVHNEKQKKQKIRVNDLACSFQKRVVEILVKKTIQAAKKYNINRILLAGGVAANSYLRKRMTEECQKHNFKLMIPEFKYCTDNAAMIATAGYYAYQKGIEGDLLLNSKSTDKLS